MEDEDVRSGDTLPVGNTTITHTVTDQFGNTASCEQMIEVIDTEVSKHVCILLVYNASG